MAASDGVQQQGSNALSNSTAIVLLVCGLPGSGKSSLARLLVDDNADRFFKVVHVEYDTIARELHDAQEAKGVPPFDEQTLQAWRISRSTALKRLDNELGGYFSSNDKKGRNMLVIMDDNFHLRSMRRDVYKTCQSHCSSNKVSLAIVWMDTHIEICRERNRQRIGRARIPDSVMDKLFDCMEPPDPQKASWEQCHLLLDNNENNVSNSLVQEKIQELLSTSLKHPVQPPPPPIDPKILQREQQATLESRLHSYDRLLRGWVGSVAQLNRSYASQANAARKDILQKLRLNSDTEPQQVLDWFLEIMKEKTQWSDTDESCLSNTLQETIESFQL